MVILSSEDVICDDGSGVGDVGWVSDLLSSVWVRRTRINPVIGPGLEMGFGWLLISIRAAWDLRTSSSSRASVSSRSRIRLIRSQEARSKRLRAVSAGLDWSGGCREAEDDARACCSGRRRVGG